MSTPSKKAADHGIEFYFPNELVVAKLKFFVEPAPAASSAAGAPAATAAGSEPSSASAGNGPPAPAPTGSTPSAPAPSGPPTAMVYKKGVATGDAWQTKPLVPTDGVAELPLEFLGKAVIADELTIEDSPFLVKGPPPPTTAPQPTPKPHQTLTAKAKLGIDFGKDKLTITVALNGGGGADANVGGGGGMLVAAAGGQGGAITVNVKQYSIQPVFEVGPLLKSDESIIIVIRCLLRYFYHWCDALNLAIDYVKNKAPKAQSEQDALTQFLGFNWWMTVFSVFAMKDMLYDIIADEADFIATILQKIGIEGKFDVTAAANVDVEVGVDANAVVSGKAYVPLAVMLAPFIEFLMAGSTAPPPEGGSLADKIVPYIEGVVEERMTVAVGGMPAAFQVEAKGRLCKATFSVPKGSPLRNKIEKLGEQVAKAANHYKDNQLKKLPDETKILRLILALLDAEVRNMVKLVRDAQKLKNGDTSGATGGVDTLSKSVETAAPYVQQIIDALNGKKTNEPPGISAEAEGVLRMLRSTKVHGVAIGTIGPLEVTDNGERKRLVLHVEEDEKGKIEGAGFAWKTAEVEAETTTLEVTLPHRPETVAWNYMSRNPRISRDYAGIVAGFDQQSGRTACRDASLARGWIPEELGRYEDQFPDNSVGMYWAWVHVGLSTYLASKQPPLPMPELTLTGEGKLRFVFDELPLGAVTEQIKNDVSLFANATIAKEKIWKIVLMDSATHEEMEEIRERVDANQPSDDPYETVLDEMLENLADGGGSSSTTTSGGGGSTTAPSQFARLGSRVGLAPTRVDVAAKAAKRSPAGASGGPKGQLKK